MRPHPFGGQDHIDRRRLLFQLPKIHPRLFENLAHRRRQDPAGLRVGGRAHACQLVRLFGEARGEAGNLITAAATMSAAVTRRPRTSWSCCLPCFVEHAFPFVGFGQHVRGHFQDWRRRRFCSFSHMMRATSSPCADSAPMRVFTLDLDQRFAERRRVVVEIRRLRIEQGERIEARRAEAEHIEGFSITTSPTVRR